MTRTPPPIGPTRRASLAALLACALPARPRAAEGTVEGAVEGAVERVTLATATPGGGFPAFGAAFAAAVRAGDPGLEVEARASGGSAENVGLLRAGAVDLALVQGEYAYPALEAGGVEALAPMYPTPGLFAARADGPARAVADLRGRPVALGTAGSGLTAMGRAVLAASGLDPERDVRPIVLARAGDGPAMVIDGRAAALWGGGLAWPGFRAVAAAPGGARFFGPDAAAVARLVRPGSALRRLTVPAGAFPGQDAAIETVGSWSLVLARPGLDADLAYRLARALDRGAPEMAARQPRAETDPRGLPGLVPAARIAPGAARYLREVGALPP